MLWDNILVDTTTTTIATPGTGDGEMPEEASPSISLEHVELREDDEPSLPPAVGASSTSKVHAPGSATADPLMDQIAKLKTSQKRLREEKLSISKDLRNAERRKKRLRTRAKQLTDDDLVAVLRMRKDIRDRGTGSTDPSSTSTGSSSASSGSPSSSSGSTVL